MTTKIAGANNVPERKALAGALAACNLTIIIPTMEATKPIDAKANGNIIISAESSGLISLKVYAIAIEAIIEPQ